LADFAGVELVKDIHTWDLAKWDAFIKELFGEENPKRTDEKPEIAALSFDNYLKWGNKQEHDVLLKEIRHEIEQMNELRKSADAELSNAQYLADFYQTFYQLLLEMQEGIPYKWEELAVKAELDIYIHQWENWSQQIESDSDDRNMYEMSLRHHNILCCWDFERRTELELNGESIDLRRYIALLACAPISETYREDCEKFLAFAKSDREGFSVEEIGTYISDIRQYIYLPMLEQEDVPNEVRSYYYDLLLELEKLINFRD